MAHDRIDWHSGADNFPRELPDEAGGTHIGMYLAWAITRGLEGEFHRQESAVPLEEVRQRHMTGREFLIRACDRKFWQEDLSDIANEFTRDYYDADTPPSYFADYEECLGNGLPTLYHVADTWANFEVIAARLDRRFDDWKRARGPIGL
jgi:hypothetical protein